MANRCCGKDNHGTHKVKEDGKEFIKDVGKSFKEGAEKVAGGAKKIGKEMKPYAKKAATEIGEGAKTFGEGVKNTFYNLTDKDPHK